jgi:hypothetical protein
MKPETRRRARFIAGFGAYFAALWLLWNTPVVYPIKIFVVLLHELSHGAMAAATGGSIVAIAISPDQGGICQCPGGNAFLTLSAGYLGSLLWGVGMLLMALRGVRWSRIGLAVLALVVGAATLLFVRNMFGVIFGLAFSAGLGAAAYYLTGEASVIVLTGLGLTSCLYAILDIQSDVVARSHLESDAHMLWELTGIPTALWGVLWIGVGVLACWWLLRWAYRRV